MKGGLAAKKDNPAGLSAYSDDLDTPKSHNRRSFEAIGALLKHMHPREDSVPVMETLEARFGSADAMFAADAHVLVKAGLKPIDAQLVSRIPEISRYMAHRSFEKHPRLDRLELAGEYLKTNFSGLKIERFYMLCVDARGKLIEDVFLQEGTLDSALFNLKNLLAEVMRVTPKAVVLSHNHPGQTLRPSQEDIRCTYDAIRALSVVGIPLLDHIIIAGNTAVSLRENGFIPKVDWIAQQPDSALLQNWLRTAREN